MKTENSPVSAYDAKLTKAEALVSAFNEANPTMKIVDSLTDRIKRMGGTTEEALAFFTEGDLTATCPTFPPIIARQIVALFKEKALPTDLIPTAWVSPRLVARMSYEELLGRYNPDEDNAVSQKLKELSKGVPFIVFLKTGGVDVKSSTTLLQEIRKGFKARPNGVMQVEGSYRTIHALGVNPDVTFEENPIYAGRALRPDGTCDQLGRSWEGVNKPIRQLIWIAVNMTKECPPPVVLENAHTLLDFALTNAPVPIQMRYPKAAAKFEELDAEGTLPTLKIKAGKAATAGNPNNSPFGKE